MSIDRYDVIIIGAGAGGATLARRLAPSGKRILLLERGPWLQREKQNWDPAEVVAGRYENAESWLDKDDRVFHSNQHYNVGGNTKFWGAALFRFRERDFEAVRTREGISPEWPLRYRDFEPYYDEVERLYDCHGLRGEDPTAPPMASEYPFAPIRHEPYMEELVGALRGQGLHPFHLPTAIRLDEARGHQNECIRCDTCDGFPCLVGAKADAEMNGVRPALRYPNVTLLSDCRVDRLLTSPSGREVVGVEARQNGVGRVFRGDIVVVACGAINSAALLLRSANEKHPRGLANGSDQVGRNYMVHLLGALVCVSTRENPTVFEKTVGINDFYWGEGSYPFPMGNIQSTGKILPEMLGAMFERSRDEPDFRELAKRTSDWWFMTEDLPDPNNRVTIAGSTLRLSYVENNRESYDRLHARWRAVLSAIEPKGGVARFMTHRVGIDGTAHQCGTLRFGHDPSTSVLDVDCKAHELDNLYCADSSFYPSSAALNPTLTLMANSLRVGDVLLARLGCHAAA